MKKIIAMFHSNYNGWSVSVDGIDISEIDDQSFVTDELVEITTDECNDDGRYFHSDLSKGHEQQATNVIVKRFGYDVEISFENDKYST